MLTPVAALLAVAAFVILVRLLWLNVRPARATTIVAIAAAVLVLSLGALAATGRLPWLAAVAAAAVPFLRRGLGLLRYLPWLGRLFGMYQGSRRGQSQQTGPRGSAMTVREACEVLDLPPEPSRQAVIDAHRRLMQKVHPDRGGSTYLAQQLNEAKRVLLESTTS